LSIIIFVGFLKSSFPSNESNLKRKSPVESKTDIESVSISDTKIFLVDSCITIPAADPRYSSIPLSADPNFN